MSRATPTSRFSVQLTHESTLGFLHLVVARCLLQNKEEVSGFYAHCYTRIRTFKLPADMIIRYDHFEVAARRSASLRSSAASGPRASAVVFTGTQRQMNRAGSSP